jgi:hypothetical protein
VSARGLAFPVDVIGRQMISWSCGSVGEADVGMEYQHAVTDAGELTKASEVPSSEDPNSVGSLPARHGAKGIAKSAPARRRRDMKCRFCADRDQSGIDQLCAAGRAETRTAASR